MPRMKKKTKKPPKMWVYVGPKREKAKITPEIKEKVQKEFEEVLEKLKGMYIEDKPPCKNFNYIIDIKSKWYRQYFYLYSIYKCPGPYAISDTFESKFTRLEYAGNNRFHLSFMRHTGDWVEVETEIPLKKCIAEILGGGYFQP